MLTEERIGEFEILEICNNSPDIEAGDRFDGIYVNQVWEGFEFPEKYAETPCVCIGKTNDERRIFKTENELCYFAVAEGWGEKDGLLVMADAYSLLRFETPTDLHGIKKFAESLDLNAESKFEAWLNNVRFLLYGLFAHSRLVFIGVCTG